MGVLEQLLGGQNSPAVSQIGRQFGLDASQTQVALEALLPAVAAGFQRNASSPQGLESLIGALAGGTHQRYVEDPSVVTNADAIADGNGILGHIFGNKSVSREVAARASAQSGVGVDVLKRMLPIVATLVMGALAKNGAQSGLSPANTGGGLGGLLGGVLESGLGGLLGGGQPTARPQPGGGLLDVLTPFLDADGDGSALDDIIGRFTR